MWQDIASHVQGTQSGRMKWRASNSVNLVEWVTSIIACPLHLQTWRSFRYMFASSSTSRNSCFSQWTGAGIERRRTDIRLKSIDSDWFGFSISRASLTFPEGFPWCIVDVDCEHDELLREILPFPKRIFSSVARKSVPICVLLVRMRVSSLWQINTV